MKRILVCIGFVFLLFGSLISFSAHLHWMSLAWIVVAMVALAQSKPAWPWLVGLTSILLIKRTGLTVELFALIFVLLAVSIWDGMVRKKNDELASKKQLVVGFCFLLGALTIFSIIRWVKTNPSNKLEQDGRPIACLGDSLTDYGYPQDLEKLLAVPVADFGVDGITTDDGIEMISEILASDPQLVVIELGGHDYNGDHKTRADTKKNLVTLIEAFQNASVDVILVEIPRGFISDPYDGLERELAAKYNLKLIDDSLIRNLIFYSPIMPPGMWLDSSRQYSNDGLHPNELGNKYFAQTVARALVDVYGEAILKPELAE